MHLHGCNQNFLALVRSYELVLALVLALVRSYKLVLVLVLALVRSYKLVLVLVRSYKLVLVLVRGCKLVVRNFLGHRFCHSYFAWQNREGPHEPLAKTGIVERLQLGGLDAFSRTASCKPSGCPQMTQFSEHP